MSATTRAHLLAQAEVWCREVEAGSLRPEAAAANIWAAHSEFRADGGEWVEDLTPFVALASERDEVSPEQEPQRVADIRDEVLRFLRHR